mgnify:CR=1 FL=1
MIDFNYILRGFEVDEYCDIIISKYGENSEVVQCLDKNYVDLVNSTNTYVDCLNAIRKFLYDNQYKNEVEYADSVFIPMIERRFCQVSKYSGLTELELRKKELRRKEKQ